MTDEVGQLVCCPWCHTEVEKPCSTLLECRTCPEPYTLTPEQAAQMERIVAERQPLRATPLPTEEN